MKKALSLLLALVMIVTCLSGISFAADPLFEVTNGDDDVQNVETVAEMVALVNANGKTKIKLLQDHYISAKGSIELPYSCEIDLNGHTIKAWDGNPLHIKAVGSENTTTVVKNGTLIAEDVRMAGMTAIRYYDGALQMENVVAYCPNGMAVANYVADTKYNADNLITGCTLVSGNYLPDSDATDPTAPAARGWSPFGFNLNTTGSNQTGISARIENTTILAVKPGGSDAIAYRKAGNTVELGKNVNIYSYHTRVANTGLAISGEELKADENTYTLPVPTGIPAKGTDSADITEYVGLKRWYTDPLATVQTGDEIVRVATLADMVATIDKKGESVVTLYDDIEATATQNIPVCTLDLNGHTWTAKNASGGWVSALYFNDTNTDADATNLYSVIKNGTVHGKIAVSCNVGALQISNATICSYDGTAVQLTDSTTATSLAKGQWNDGNIVENSTLYSANFTSLIFNSSGKDFSAVTFAVRNSDMITQGAKSVLLSNQSAAGTVAGTFDIGTGMNFYYQELGGVARTAAPAPTLTGEAITKLDGTWAVEVAGTAYEGFTRSTTETQVTSTVNNTPENGTVTLSPAQAYSGQTVTVDAVPDEGYEVDTIIVNGEPIEGNEFAMPKGGASVQVTFKKKTVSEESVVIRPTNHNIVIETVEGGTVTASAAKATINTIIKLDVQAAEGYVLESITVKKLYNGTNAKVAEDNSFYMPYSNVVITPVFKKA